MSHVLADVQTGCPGRTDRLCNADLRHFLDKAKPGQTAMRVVCPFCGNEVLLLPRWEVRNVIVALERGT